MLPHDEFLKEVKTIPYQYRHPFFLYALARWLRPSVIVEVGTHLGMSAVWMARALQENGTGRLFCIDNFCWIQEPQEEQWHANVKKCGVADSITLIKGRSESCQWPEHVDMAFIDGNHTYDVCSHDAAKARKLGASCIILHDTVSWEGSRKYAEEVRSSWESWDFLEENSDCGLLICKKREPKTNTWGQDIGGNWDKQK